MSTKEHDLNRDDFTKYEVLIDNNGDQLECVIFKIVDDYIYYCGWYGDFLDTSYIAFSIAIDDLR